MQNEQSNELCDRFVTSTIRLYRLALLEISDDVEKMDMTLPQLKTLVLLDDRGQLRMGVIVGHLGRSFSATTVIVDGLVKQHMVKRASDPLDRRVVLCELAAGGRKVVERFNRLVMKRAWSAMKTWDPERLEAVVAAMESIKPRRR